MLRNLQDAFWEIYQFCLGLWFILHQALMRHGLRPSAFRLAGTRAGRSGDHANLTNCAFLQSAKAAADQIMSLWSSCRLSVVTHWLPIKDVLRSESIETQEKLANSNARLSKIEEEITRLQGLCRRRFGSLPSCSPLRGLFFWGGLLLGGVVEFFLNGSALQSAGQSERLTQVLALILSAAFVFGIHHVGKRHASGESYWFPVFIIVALMAAITGIRESAIVAYFNSLQGSSPEVGSSQISPWIYVLVFSCVQMMFFYLGCHWSADYNEPLLQEMRVLQMDRWIAICFNLHLSRKLSANQRSICSINARLDQKAIEWASEFHASQCFFDHGVKVFAHAADRQGNRITEDHMVELAKPPLMDWIRTQLSGSSPDFLNSLIRVEQATLEESPSPSRKNGIALTGIAIVLAFSFAGQTIYAEAIHSVVLIDLSPSMKPNRPMQLNAIRKIIATWPQQRQVVDFIGVDNNPLGRDTLAHLAPFPYDPGTSNPIRYRLETVTQRRSYLASIPSAIDRAMAAEDERINRNASLNQTCLVDALELADRLFRRTRAASRELIVLSDGYEDCLGSVHLPRDKLSSQRIDAINRDLALKERLPHFASSVDVLFVGTRLSAASPRTYEDLLEKLWVRLLTTCGARISPERFASSWPDGGLNDVAR